MSDTIKWVVKPKSRRYVRIDYHEAPTYAQEGFGPFKPLFELREGCGYEFIFADWLLFRIFERSVSDLASGMHFIPRNLASRDTWNGWKDDGAHVHDGGHAGALIIPGVDRGRAQCRIFDRVMLALWQDAYARNPHVNRFRGRWQDGQPRRNYRMVRLASPFLWRPNYDNLSVGYGEVIDITDGVRPYSEIMEGVA